MINCHFIYSTHVWRDLNSIHQYRGLSRKRTPFSCNIIKTSGAEVNVYTYSKIKLRYSVKSHVRTTCGERSLGAQCQRRTSVLKRKSNKKTEEPEKLIVYVPQVRCLVYWELCDCPQVSLIN